MTDASWVPLGDRVLHDGWHRVIERSYRLPDGRTTTWELLAARNSVAVLALTTDGSVVLVRQFRPGPDRQMVTLPGGLIDAGETVVDGARRELREETGWEPARLEVVQRVVRASTTQMQYAAVAYDCTPAGPQQLDEFEDCAVLVVSPAEVLRLLRAGAMSGTQLVWPALDAAGLL